MKTYDLNFATVMLPKKKTIKNNITKNLETACDKLEKMNHMKTKMWLLLIFAVILTTASILGLRYIFADTTREPLLAYTTLVAVITGAAILCIVALFVERGDYKNIKRDLQNTKYRDSYLNDVLYLYELCKNTKILDITLTEYGLCVSYADENKQVTKETLFEEAHIKIEHVIEQCADMKLPIIHIASSKNEIKIVNPYSETSHHIS